MRKKKYWNRFSWIDAWVAGDARVEWMWASKAQYVTSDWERVAMAASIWTGR